MFDPKSISRDLEAFVASGFGADAANLELDCLALATCFDKSSDDEKAHAKLAKKALKKHASAPVLAALSKITRRNYLPKKHTTASTFAKDSERLHDFEALAQIGGFDYIAFAARLVAIHPPLLINLLSRRDLTFFKAYFEDGHPRDTLTFEDVDHPGGYRYDHVFTVAELKVLASISRFTSLEFETDAKKFPLPADLSTWCDLESLTIRAKNISSISQARVDALGALPKLTRLGLHMRLESLPKNLAPWETLTSLELPQNQLNELPGSFASLTGLRVLDLSNNPLLAAIRDGVGDMKSLEELDLRGTPLTSCSLRLGELKSLRTLRMSGHKDTGDIFAALGRLTGLEHLFISDMEHVTKLPDSIGALTRLETLDIRDLRNFNAWFSGLGRLTRLRVLRLRKLGWWSGGAKATPQGFGELEHLEILDLTETSLPDFPVDVVRCSELRELHLGKSYSSAPPEDIGKLTCLEVLDLTTIPIERYPDTFFELRRLKTLKMGGHRGRAPNPPEAIGNLEALEYLTLESAGISELPESIGTIESLKRLDLSFNPIKGFPEGFDRLANLEFVEGTGSLSPELEPHLAEYREKMPWCRFWNFC